MKMTFGETGAFFNYLSYTLYATLGAWMAFDAGWAIDRPEFWIVLFFVASVDVCARRATVNKSHYFLYENGKSKAEQRTQW